MKINMTEILDRMEVLEEEVKEVRMQGEAIRMREEHLRQRYAKLQARYTYVVTRLDVLERYIKMHRKEDAIGSLPIAESNKKENEPKRIEKTSDMSHLLTAAEAAEMMDVSTRSVMTYLKNGDLEATKIKGEWRIRPEDVRDFLHSHPIRRRAKKEE